MSNHVDLTTELNLDELILGLDTGYAPATEDDFVVYQAYNGEVTITDFNSAVMIYQATLH